MFGICSEIFITIIFIVISWGWTILYNELEDLELYIPVGLLVAIIEVVIVGLGKITDDSHAKYHQYDGWAGIFVIFIRIGFYIYFMYMLSDTFKKAR